MENTDVKWVLEELNKQQAAGEIKGITAQVVLHDGSFATMHAGDLSYIEKVGLLESAKQNLLVEASE